jgi:SAM-dependent methyltransferase
MTNYIIRGGGEGKARLRLLSRVLQPSTGRLLDQVGVTDGMSCLDVGCGGGDVTLELAHRVGPRGAVVGLDADAAILELARGDAAAAGLGQVRFDVADAADWRPEPAFDLVYARFLLSHLAAAPDVMNSMARAARAGGAVAVEDIDFAGHFCHPPCRAFERYVSIYRETVRRRGGDADLGPRLPALFLAAGVEAVRVQVVQPAALRGEAKSVAALTLDKIADAVVAAGVAAASEVAALVAELEEFAADPQTLMSLPRIFQVWGRTLDRRG